VSGRREPREEPWRGIRAADLAKMLSGEVMDADDAARFLGIARNSLEYAAYRKRLPHVRYGAKKLFTRADLEDYAHNRGRGRDSRLQPIDPYVVNRRSEADEA
jgi:hypothetical protein